MIERLVRWTQTARLRQWERDRPPGRVALWAMQHPIVVTLLVAAVLAGALGAVFGVPPFSPLVLVVLVASPVYAWLLSGRELHAAWVAGELEEPERPPGAHDRDDGADGHGDEGDEGGDGGGSRPEPPPPRGRGGGGVTPPVEEPDPPRPSPCDREPQHAS